MASAPSAPTPPDPVATASAQAQANAGTATAQTALNNANEVTPLGNVNYNVTGSQSYTNPDGSVSSVPTYTETQTLSQPEQQLFNQQVGLGEQHLSRRRQHDHAVARGDRRRQFERAALPRPARVAGVVDRLPFSLGFARGRQAQQEGQRHGVLTGFQNSATGWSSCRRCRAAKDCTRCIPRCQA